MTDVTVTNRRVDSSANEDLTTLARHGADAFGYKANLRIDRQLAQLLRLRVSQINNCTYCLNLHYEAARDAGVPRPVIDTLTAWWETDFHDDAARAALAYTEAITRVADATVADDFGVRHAALAEHFSQEEILEIIGIVINMNVWTRLKLAEGATPGARRAGDVVNPLTCQAAVRAASDQLAGQLSDAERGALEEHLGGCDSCSCLMDQLYSTIAILRSRPEVQVPHWLAAMVAHTGGGRAEALTAQLPHLYALANALDADAADDLVQETVTSALADPDADTTGAGLAGALTRLAVDRGPEVQSPAVPTPGSDPDADEPELFYPGLYADAPDAGAWVDQPVAWGEARVLGPEDDLVTTEPTRPWTQRSPTSIRSTPDSSLSSTSKGRH